MEKANGARTTSDGSNVSPFLSFSVSKKQGNAAKCEVLGEVKGHDITNEEVSASNGSSTNSDSEDDLARNAFDDEQELISERKEDLNGSKQICSASARPQKGGPVGGLVQHETNKNDEDKVLEPELIYSTSMHTQNDMGALGATKKASDQAYEPESFIPSITSSQQELIPKRSTCVEESGMTKNEEKASEQELNRSPTSICSENDSGPKWSAKHGIQYRQMKDEKQIFFSNTPKNDSVPNRSSRTKKYKTIVTSKNNEVDGRMAYSVTNPNALSSLEPTTSMHAAIESFREMKILDIEPLPRTKTTEVEKPPKKTLFGMTKKSKKEKDLKMAEIPETPKNAENPHDANISMEAEIPLYSEEDPWEGKNFLDGRKEVKVEKKRKRSWLLGLCCKVENDDE